MGAAAAEPRAFGALESGGQSERIGNLEGAGQEAGGENGVQNANRIAQRSKTHGQTGAKRRQWQQLQSGLCDYGQQTLGADQEPGQIETGFVFMGAAAELDNRAAGQ